MEMEKITLEELNEILGLTIKKDEINKLLVFLCLLSAYTEDSQFNISFNAPSSTGKTYIPLEIATLFPEEDVKKLAYCSPASFFHDVGEYVKEKEGYIVNLERKILIFVDQPHTLLLQHLRPLLSHDQKEIQIKITDKGEKYGLRTKNIFIKGFPAVIFCTGNLKIDEQEATRFLLLSPETNQEKIREAINQKIRKETDIKAYQSWLENDSKRQLLKERIKCIKNEHISEIKIASPEKIKETFFQKNKILKPRHMRDISRLISIAKILALLNLWDRERDGSTIIANDEDIQQAFQIWDTISESQELNLPPYVYNIFCEVILPSYRETQEGITRQEILKKYLEVYGRPLADWQLRQQIIPMLEASGLITQQPDPNDKRKILIFPMIDTLPHHPTHYLSETGNSDIEIVERDSEGNPTLIRCEVYGEKELFKKGKCLKCGKENTWVMKSAGNNICYECHKEIEARETQESNKNSIKKPGGKDEQKLNSSKGN
ncbi:MAG: hypothetical protein J7L39_01795 [Candidatus Aenigmarchaeota archaeon]|nr:hypothetical protein [Candidatus Aenigmarchaeota archaeon]